MSVPQVVAGQCGGTGCWESKARCVACLFLAIAAQGHPAACPQLAKADLALSSQHVREGQRIAELEAEFEALQRQALALGAEPPTFRRGFYSG